MTPHDEVEAALKALAAFLQQNLWSVAERRAMVRAVSKAIIKKLKQAECVRKTHYIVDFN